MDYEKLQETYDFNKIKTNYTYNSAKLRITEIKRSDGEHMSRKEMIKMSNTFLAELKAHYPNADGLVSVSIKYPQRWYSGDVSSFNKPINYFTPSDSDLDFDDPEQYECIRFQFIPFTKTKEGGTDYENNDCLAFCLMKYFKATKKFIVPADLKEFLELERDELIPVSMMHHVECYINEKESIPFAIFISGDAEYISPIQTNKKIHITLSKGHYSVNKSKVSKSCRQNYDEKPIVMVEKVNDICNAYDGEKEFVMCTEEYDESKNKYLSCPVLVVDKNVTKETNKMSLVDAYHYYIEMADELRDKSDGKFNLYKVPTIKNLALNHFYSLTKAIQPDEINNSEASWINAASSHAIMYHEKYEGQVHVYDINSRYPHIMQKSQHHFPIREGTWKTITNIEEKPEYGIYRCKITKLDNKPYKFFVFNDDNHYTHLDVAVAFSYGLKVDLLDGVNFLFYPKESLMAGSYLFKKYVDDLYGLKQEKVKGAKLLLNILWGSICEKKIYKQSTELSEKRDFSGGEITRLQCDDTHVRTHFTKPTENQFRTNYGRAKPYILAYARSQNYWSFRKYEPLIVRMHTDSFYMTENPSDMLPPSDKLGMAKLEYAGYVKIMGLNKVVKTNA